MAPPPRQPRIDRSFLGETAIRLARLLGVGGLISPEFDSGEKVLPVVLVGDATQPGYRGQALRSWSYAELVLGVAGNTSKFALKAPPGKGIIIDGFALSSGAVLPWRASMMGSDSADPFAITQTNIRFTERMVSDDDNTGILTVGHNADALTYGLTFGLGLHPGNQTQPVYNIPLMLAPGAKIIFTNTTVNSALYATVWGRSL